MINNARFIILASVAALLALAAATPVSAATFTVNSTLDTDDATPEGTCDSDPGAPVVCTLREAIKEANFVAGTDTINFSIGTDLQTIVLGSSLPNVTQATIIDGTTQPGFFTGTPLIEINGNNVASTGIVLQAGNSTVKGLVINRINGSGVTLTNFGSNTVSGNFIGTDATGTVDLGNTAFGILIMTSSGSNCIGGTIISSVCTPGATDRNVISGNTGDGIAILAGAGTANTIVGNYIGTNAAGAADLGNGQAGILSRTASNCIGGTIISSVCTPSAAGRNVISGNDSRGIDLDAATSNRVMGNYIGINAAGSGALGNTGFGIRTVNLASSNVIGGSSADARNVISANNNNGIHLATNSNQVLGNYIGTNATGTIALGNGGDGVQVESGAGNVIGGTTGVTPGGPCAGTCNLISGNALAGVRVFGATGTTVAGNFIGTDAAGAADLGNSADGITVSQPTIVGGTATGAGNLISGNNQDGVEISGTAANTTTVQGNLIGTNATGSAGIGNSLFGIRIQDASDNTIGGSTAAANTIAFNGSDGVFMITSISAPTGNSVRRNRIHSNNQLGIDLAPGDVTANDAGDGDTGPNNLQNFPVLSGAVKQGSTTLVIGTLNSTANTTFDLDFYASATCDASGNGEGARYLGTASATTDGIGNVSFSSIAFVASSQIGEFVTATATRSAAPLDTSEFSNCVSVAHMVVDTTSDTSLAACNPTTTGDCSLRGAIANANNAPSPGDLITFNIPVVPDPGCDDITSVCTITISSALPNMTTGGDTIDGTVATIIVDGLGEPSVFPCLLLDGADNMVKGLQITDCSSGIQLGGSNNTVGPDNVIYDNGNFGVSVGGAATGNVIKGNKIGTSAAGIAVHPDGGNGTGISINGSGNTVGGSSAADRNVISGNGTGVNISIGGSNDNVVKGNYIGTDVTGAVDLGNTASGVNLSQAVSGNLIGGTAAGEGNVISGNNQNGVRIFGSAAVGRPDRNSVQGNLIGTNASGTADLGNSVDGIVIDGGLNNCIGGAIVALVCSPASGGRNVISGNDASGVRIVGDSPTGNKLFGNYIGTDVSGSADLGNSQYGVGLQAGATSVIGSFGFPGPNVISGNNQIGVFVSGAGANNVEGNLIGTTASGTAPLGNSNQSIVLSSANNNSIFLNVIAAGGEDGVQVSGASSGNTIYGNRIGTDLSGTIPLGNAGHGVYLAAASTTVGGTGINQSNFIAYNGGDGVRVDGGSATQNPVRANFIHHNSGKGIENINGGNGELLPPTVTSAGSAAGTSSCLNCTVDVFSDSDSPNAEGRTYQGSTTSDGSGNWSFAGAVAGPHVTATVTNATGNTSEFSAPFACPDDDADLLCPSSDPCDGDADCDNDSWMDGVEANFIGTDPQDACPDNTADNAWPPDFNNDTHVDITDIGAVAGSFGDASPPTPARKNIAPQPPDGFVDIGDIGAVAGLFGESCTP